MFPETGIPWKYWMWPTAANLKSKSICFLWLISYIYHWLLFFKYSVIFLFFYYLCYFKMSLEFAFIFWAFKRFSAEWSISYNSPGFVFWRLMITACPLPLQTEIMRWRIWLCFYASRSHDCAEQGEHWLDSILEASSCLISWTCHLWCVDSCSAPAKSLTHGQQ